MVLVIERHYNWSESKNGASNRAACTIIGARAGMVLVIERHYNWSKSRSNRAAL